MATAGERVRGCRLELGPDGLPLLFHGGLGKLEHSVKILVCSRYFKTEGPADQC